MAGTEIETINVTNISIETDDATTIDLDLPPDGGYGWVQVAVAFTINTFTWGQTAVCFLYPFQNTYTTNPKNL